MIDIHFHCLPGIDDGPREWAEAVELCRQAGSEGTHTIVATPHVLRAPWLNENPLHRRDLVEKLNDRLGGTPKVLVGCEYAISSDALELLRMGDQGPLVGLNRTRYLLVEFTTSSLPRDIEFNIHEMIVAGHVPVIAHPERHPIFISAPEKLQRLIDLGALAQLTAGSILGDFGKQAEKTSHRLIDAGLIHLVASDAHSLSKRPPRLAAAYERIRSMYGDAIAEDLAVRAPTEVVNSVEVLSNV